jgi:hypothetical protein
MLTPTIYSHHVSRISEVTSSPPYPSISSNEKLQGSATFTRSRRRLFVGALVVYWYRITWLTVHSQGDKGVFLEKKVKPLFVRPLPSVLLRHCRPQPPKIFGFGFAKNWLVLRLLQLISPSYEDKTRQAAVFA